MPTISAPTAIRASRSILLRISAPSCTSPTNVSFDTSRFSKRRLATLAPSMRETLVRSNPTFSVSKQSKVIPADSRDSPAVLVVKTI